MLQWVKDSEQAKRHCMQQESDLNLIASLTPPRRSNPFSTQPAFLTNTLQQLQSGGAISDLPSLWRTRRQAEGLLNPDEDDLYDFLNQFQDFRSKMMLNVGNLSCVLKQMELFTPEGEINMELYTGDWNQEGYSFDVEGSAAADPAWRQKFTDAYSDCYKISQTWPQTSLNRNPLSKVFGRHMIFFKCTKKAEKKLCAQAQMLEWLEKLYGTVEPEMMAEHLDNLGLPEDKYDAAAISIAVMDNSYNDQERFVDEFFWGKH